MTNPAAANKHSEPLPAWWDSAWKHALRCVPNPLQAIAGSVVWAAAMGASALFSIWMLEWETAEKIRAVVILFLLGGALAFPLGLFIARLFSLGRSAETAFAAAFLGLAVATTMVTGLLFAFAYRSYYAEWHGEFGSISWVFQFVFTTLAALYQFAVLGVRLLFPVGFVALFAASIWFARMPR